MADETNVQQLNLIETDGSGSEIDKSAGAAGAAGAADTHMVKNKSSSCNTEHEDVIDCDVPENGKGLYVARKPRWWRIHAGRRGTKGQRKAINRMTQAGFVLPTLYKRFNHHLLLDMVFQVPSEKTLSADEILVPQRDCNETTSLGYSSNDGKRICLEIGFGLGDNLLTNAWKFPDKNYIGAEIHQPGVGIALMRMEKARNSKSFWMEQTWFDDSDKKQQFVLEEKRNSIGTCNEEPTTIAERPYDNLRIYPGDGIKLLAYLPSNSIDEIYLTFPDPWAKECNKRFRVIQETTLDDIAKVLKHGGCFYLATDSMDFHQWTQSIFTSVAERTGMWEKVTECPDRRFWLPVVSKYEEEGLKDGRSTNCSCWRCVVQS